MQRGENFLETEPAACERGRGFAAFSCGRHEEEEAGARVPEEGSQIPGERGEGAPPSPEPGSGWVPQLVGRHRQGERRLTDRFCCTGSALAFIVPSYRHQI